MPTQPVEGLAVAVLDAPRRSSPELRGPALSRRQAPGRSGPFRARLAPCDRRWYEACVAVSTSRSRPSFCSWPRPAADRDLTGDPARLAGAGAVSPAPRRARASTPFTILKFRTMRARRRRDAASRVRHRRLIGGNSQAERGRLYKLSVDDRITRVGALAALVEPRRAAPADQCPARRDGLGGAATRDPLRGRDVSAGLPASLCRQARPDRPVAGERSQRAHLRRDGPFDIEYAEADSLLLDLRILLKTVPVVLTPPRGGLRCFEIDVSCATPRPEHPAPPSRLIGTAIVGYGYWGPNLARNVAECPEPALGGPVRAASPPTLRPLQPAPPRGVAR